MTHDSLTVKSSVGSDVYEMPAPRKSTLNLIRQFARTYTALPGVAFSAMSIN